MLMKELKPSEILKCMDLCGDTNICTTDRHACAYGDEGCIDCVDRLEADIQALIDAGDNLILLRTAPENKAAEKPRCDRCEHCTHAPSQKADGFTYYCDLSGRDVGQSHFGHNSPRACPLRTPENNPLTLEQLRQMARDLLTSCVVHEAEKADCAAIIDYDNIGKFGPKNNIIAVVSAFGQPLLEKDYAKTWLAYAHKPEQEADHEKA